MDSSIYLDNVRGFQRSLISLSRIALLVGENSSGKSSFLALAHLLMSDDFWVRPDFNSLGHDFASFDELVSRSSKNRRTFDVGCALADARDAGPPFVALVTFENREDIPAVKRVTYLHGDRIVQFWVSRAEARWIDVCGLGELPAWKCSEDLLRCVVEIHCSKRANRGSTLSKKRVDRDTYVILTASNLIERELQKSRLEEKPARGFLPHPALRSGTWFAPIRAEPKRVYEKPSESVFSPIGQHTPYLVRDIVKRRADAGFEQSAYRLIESFGSRSGLFDDLDVKSFGRSSASPFSLSVQLDGHSFNVGEVGYGVSQVLPIVAEMFGGASASNIFLQQPEVHLHPRAQAEIANILYIYSSQLKSSVMLVETHSDYLIDRLRILIREDFLDASKDIDASLYWFERHSGVNVVHRIPIDRDGQYAADVPDGYRDFFVKESLRGLGFDADN